MSTKFFILFLITFAAFLAISNAAQIVEKRSVKHGPHASDETNSPNIRQRAVKRGSASSGTSNDPNDPHNH